MPLGRPIEWPINPDDVARIERGIDRSAGPGSCHPWKQAKDRAGYSIMKLHGVCVKPHRLVLSLKLGRALLPKEVTRHSNECTTTSCCNADHLSVGSHVDNAKDASEAGRQGRRLTATQVRQIRIRAMYGEPDVELAHRFSVSFVSIKEVVSGRTWKQLPDGPHGAPGF